MFYTSGALPRAFFRKDASFSLVVSTTDTLAGIDTLRRLDITCVGQNANYPDPISWMMKNQYANFYLPQCGPTGAQNVHPYHRVIYPEIYNYIDMHVYSGSISQKLAFVINPGGDPKDITLQFEGQDYMDVDIYGNLKLLIDGKWVVLPEAIAYQVEPSGSILPVNWTASFNAYNNVGRVYFDFEAFDHTRPLIFLIGPPAMGGQSYDENGLCWSTYYGAEDFDMLSDVQSDMNGNFYVAGRSESGWANFPHFPGTSTSVAGSSVATLTKFSASHVLQWTVFQGGGPEVDYSYTAAAAIAVKNTPTEIYMVGRTNAFDFFTQFQAGAYNELTNELEGDKGFISKYGASGELLWSTYVGMLNVQVQAIDVVPGDEQFVIAGIMQDTLLLPNRLPPANGQHFYYHGGGDAFVALFNPNDNVAWSACYGGQDREHRALVRVGTNYIVLAGNTESTDIPLVGSTPSFVEAYHGGTDVFIAQLSLTGHVQWATYFGGEENDTLAPQGIDVNKDLFLVGKSGPLPSLEPGNSGWFDGVTATSGDNGFLARFDDEGRPMWITYLGEGTNHSPYCITADNHGNVTVGGYTNDPGFDALQWPGYYFQPDYEPDLGNLDQDAFLVRFDQNEERVWSTLFGGNAGGLAQPQNIRALHEAGGSIYAVGYTTMPPDAPTNYFPLDGMINAGYFFNPNYNYSGQQGDFSDGFITEFCHEMPTGTPEVHREQNDFRASWSVSGELTLWGLANGYHQLRIMDPTGRLVLKQEVSSQGGRSEVVRFADRSMAVYLLNVDNQMTTRLIPTR
ncbi:MAG: hypothetical protein KF843_11880 [Flavobacteriales bacterium]|nr:hypothetical protein [Flavobacteriales bacterium]